MGSELKAGDLVYLDDGVKAELVSTLECVLGGGLAFVVRPIREVWPFDDAFDFDESSPVEEAGPVEMVSKIWPKPPVAVIDERVVEAESRLRAAEETLTAVETEWAKAEREHRGRLKRLAVLSPLLEHIEDVIEGRITHFVLVNWRELRVVEAGKLTRVEDGVPLHRNPTLRLLSLNGKSGGDLTWGVNRWSDGSGLDEEVIPCVSEEEATSILRGVIEKQLERHSGNAYVLNDLIPAADKAGVAVPDEARLFLHNADLKKAEKRLNKTAEEHRKARDEWDALLLKESS